jgi:hypothetical protein
MTTARNRVFKFNSILNVASLFSTTVAVPETPAVPTLLNANTLELTTVAAGTSSLVQLLNTNGNNNAIDKIFF